MENYKGIKITGKHGVGFRFVHNNQVWTFNRIKAAKQFIDEIQA